MPVVTCSPSTVFSAWMFAMRSSTLASSVSLTRPPAAGWPLTVAMLITPGWPLIVVFASPAIVSVLEHWKTQLSPGSRTSLVFVSPTLWLPLVTAVTGEQTSSETWTSVRPSGSCVVTTYL